MLNDALSVFVVDEVVVVVVDVVVVDRVVVDRVVVDVVVVDMVVVDMVVVDMIIVDMEKVIMLHKTHTTTFLIMCMICYFFMSISSHLTLLLS